MRIFMLISLTHLSLSLSARVPGSETEEFGYQWHSGILLLSGWPGGALAIGFGRQLADLSNDFSTSTAHCGPVLFCGAGECPVADNAQ